MKSAEESVADKDEIELCLRDIPTSELPQVADVAILQAPAVVPELERRITIQSNKFGQSNPKYFFSPFFLCCLYFLSSAMLLVNIIISLRNKFDESFSSLKEKNSS
mmetsp:Transcript_39308/g.54801  ORF Transcript_39308/g.54801 Transcript_39308/m.54801 type:complete len:106 (+) Transcript_39308:865-1182(+)